MEYTGFMLVQSIEFSKSFLWKKRSRSKIFESWLRRISAKNWISRDTGGCRSNSLMEERKLNFIFWKSRYYSQLWSQLGMWYWANLLTFRCFISHLQEKKKKKTLSSRVSPAQLSKCLCDFDRNTWAIKSRDREWAWRSERDFHIQKEVLY